MRSIEFYGDCEPVRSIEDESSTTFGLEYGNVLLTEKSSGHFELQGPQGVSKDGRWATPEG
jgi:hypothetical protein